MSLNQKERTEVLTIIKKRVVSNHFNAAGVDHGAWVHRVDERTPALLTADTENFEAGVRELVKELKSSHTLFYHERTNHLPPQHALNATLRSFEIDGARRWVFLDVFVEGPADKAGIKPGDVLVAVDESRSAPPIVPPFQLGRTYRLTVSNADGRNLRTMRVDLPIRKGTKQRPPIIEPKSPIHRIVAPRIGLLNVPYFPDPTGLGFAKALDGAIRDLENHGCERLIIDLRGHIGGGLGFARLASYLCPGKIPIGHSLTPGRLRAGYDRNALPRVPMPSSRTELLLTLLRYAIRDKSVVLLTQGLGPQPFHGKIVILANEWTNSAGEILAGFAAENNLATIVGTTTAGNVLGAVNLPVGYSYWLRLPVFGWYTSQGLCLEEVGVVPTVRFDIGPSGLAQEIDPQLDLAVQIVNGRSIIPVT
jgi:C-terminal processing protease CtpA/Prc